MEEWRFNLSKPIKVSKDGGFEEVHEVVFTAPNYKCRDNVVAVEQIISRAFADMAFKRKEIIGEGDAPETRDNSEEVEAIPAKEMKAMLSMSDQNMEHFYKSVEVILLKTGTVLDGVSLKKEHFNSISLSDYSEMSFGYAGNFIAPSLIS